MATSSSSHATLRARLLERFERAPRNDFGAGVSVVGILAGELASAVALGIAYGALGHGRTPSMLVRDVVGLVGLWVGFVATALWASTSRSPGRKLSERLRDDFGLKFAASDLPIGIAAGLFGQYVLVTVLELPLYPFVPHLFTRLGAPAKSLTAGQSSVALALLGVLVCLGSPLVEELFFRGLFLRGLIGVARTRLGWSALASVLGSAALSGVVFGLVHAEPLQLIALSGFGMLLALLACVTGRLGAGIVAHVTFNSLTFVALAVSH